MFIVVLLMSVRKCTYMYDYIRLCTTYYDTMFKNVRQCSTMYANVRQKILPYDRIFVAPKSFTCNTFFLIRSIAYENLRLTANNRDKSRQHTKNYDFLIRTLKFVCGRPALNDLSRCCYTDYHPANFPSFDVQSVPFSFVCRQGTLSRQWLSLNNNQS